MSTELTLAPFLAEGDWHSLLSRYLLCAPWVEGNRVLDLMCGRGLGCEVLRRLGANEVVGVDSRSEVLGWAKSQLSPELDFQQVLDTNDIPFEDASFDVVLAISGQIRPGRSTLDEVKRVLSPHGVLIVLEYPETYSGLAAVLPQYDRPPRPSTEAALSAAELHEIFGHPLVFTEEPQLVTVYRCGDATDEDASWSQPDETLLGIRRRRRADQRIMVYGSPTRDLPNQRIRLPYSEVADQLVREFRESSRRVEVLQLNQSILEGQLGDREKLVTDLDMEVYQGRQRLAELQVEFERLTAGQLHANQSQSTADLAEMAGKERQIEELWECAVAWQQHAEGLQGELEQVKQLPVTTQTPSVPPPNGVQVSALEAAIDLADRRRADAESEAAASRDGLSRAYEEINRRDKLVRRLESKLAEAEGRLDSFTEEVRDTYEECHVLRRNLASIEEKLATYENKQVKIQESSLSLENEIRSKALKIQALERERMGLKIELSSIQKQNTSLIQAKVKQDRENTKQRDELDAFRAHNGELEAELIRLKTANEAAATKSKPRKKAPPKPSPTAEAKVETKTVSKAGKSQVPAAEKSVPKAVRRTQRTTPPALSAPPETVAADNRDSKKPKARRTRRKAGATAPAVPTDTKSTASPPTAASSSTRTRRRKAAADETPAVTQAAPTKARRSRSKLTQKEPSKSTATGAAKSTVSRRRRKPAVEKPAVSSPKPKTTKSRRTRRKSTPGAPSAAESTTPITAAPATSDAAPTENRRTRRARPATAVTAAVVDSDTSEKAPQKAKSPRTRTSKAVSSVKTAKPKARRTRTRRTSPAAADAAPTAPSVPPNISQSDDSAVAKPKSKTRRRKPKQADGVSAKAKSTGRKTRPAKPKAASGAAVADKKKGGSKGSKKAAPKRATVSGSDEKVVSAKSSRQRRRKAPKDDAKKKGKSKKKGKAMGDA